MADLDVPPNPNLIEAAGNPNDDLERSDEDDEVDHREAERQVRKLSASYRSQTGHLTRVIERATSLVDRTHGRPVPSQTMCRELDKVLGHIWDQQEKCAHTCELILENQDHLEDNDANVVKTNGCLERDAARGDEVAVEVTRELVRCEIALRPPAPVAAGVPGQARIICKPEKDLKPSELSAEMSPVEFAYWVDAFEAYHAGSNMQVATIAVQQAFLKACVNVILYNQIEQYITAGVTPVLGQGDSIIERL